MMNKVTQELPPKEASSFKQLIKLYETKNYKKGLKSAEKLLEVVPQHAETMSLKSIFLYLTGKQDEGYELGKQALNLNMKSDICWHIYGIINRSKRNYKEAVKCYKFALTISPGNMQILRDLALLQIQIRDLAGYADTRLKLLRQKESLVINWVQYAVAEHLRGDYDSTIKLLDSIYKITADNSLKKVEQSELYIYEAFVHLEAKNYQKCIEVLDTYAAKIVDQVVKGELLIQCYMELKQFDKAQELSRQLIDSNPNNKKFHSFLVQAQQAQGGDVVQIYEEILKKAPNSQSAKLSILQACSVDQFEQKFQEYIIPYFRKSLPSLFSELRNFYKSSQNEQTEASNKQKVQIIQKVLEQNLQSLSQEKSTFANSDEAELPNCLLWNYMILAQHYDRIGKSDLAIEFVNKAISHTPTLVELYLVKAKIYKHIYNYTTAYELANKARTLDLADRYLNNKAIKYALRLNKTSEAEQLMRLFIRDPRDGNEYDLQTIWFENAMGASYLRKKEIGAAMRQYKFIEKHYSDMYEDQFDFHTYCMRKYSLKSYVEMIRYEDNICNSKFYVGGAAPMIETLTEYQDIILNKKNEQQKEDELLSKMNSKEKKAYKRDKEKAAAKKEKELEALKKADPFYEYRLKLDLDGKEYLESLTNPLKEADNYAQKLINLDFTEPQVAFRANRALVDLYIARGKDLLALKALKKLIKSNVNQPEIYLSKIKVIYQLQKSLKNQFIKGVVREVIQEELDNLLAGQTVEQLNKSFISSLTSVEQELFFSKLQFITSEISKEQYAEKVEQIVSSQISNLTIELAVTAFDIINKYSKSIKQETRDILAKQFPQADYFNDWEKADAQKKEQENGK